ncbi:nitronate monooxygenase [Salibacterium salarium]|uniref:NAD(P)H-dependent flavin oxidoreductase n=1 Tax=Salibacterium salarium TaxID=284579 RepID=UPI0027864547|nr:nitronate monooxygenase [Salibacterium salarium]MDQ0298463.1 nitronate monooxygenase [Salibacterium salarium]
MSRNRMTDILHVDLPLIQAGMAGGVTTPHLVAAVSNAGALGTLGAGYMSAEAMEDSINQIQKRTTQSFGVNLFIPEYPLIKRDEIEEANQFLEPYREKLQIRPTPSPDYSKTLFEEQVNVIFDKRVPVCSFTFGVPSQELIQDLQKAGIVTIGTATTVEEAMINEEQGIDIVVAQGSEAGGHRGTFSASYENAMVGTMALVPQIVDNIRIPVIAAGGIMDGRGMTAALALGAEGVQMGTAFVTSEESGAKVQHKRAISNSSEADSILTSVFSGKPARGIQNQFIRDMQEHADTLPGYPILNNLTKDIRKEAALQNRPEFMSLWAGQAPRLSQTKSARDIIADIVKESNTIRKKFKEF